MTDGGRRFGDLQQRARRALCARVLAKLEQALSERQNQGPYFSGDQLSLVDAAYAPFFQRFRLCDTVLETHVLNDFPLVQSWADGLAGNDAVIGSVADSFQEKFVANLVKRGMVAGPKLAAA